MTPGRTLAATLAAALLLTGCAQSVDPIERMGRKAAQGVRHHHAAPAAAPPAGPAGTVPPVIDHIATRDKVVFLTYDLDGDHPGARGLAALVREKRLPLSVFLARPATRSGPLARLRALGADIENRTFTRASLPGLGYVAQHTQICAQQDSVAGRFGRAPRLLRPPEGGFDAATLRAAAACGIEAIVLWTHEAPDPPHLHLHLHPGDIIKVGGGRRPADTTATLLREIRSQGYEVAHLNAYL